MSHSRGSRKWNSGAPADSALGAQGAPEIAQVKMSRDGQGSDNTPPYIPKENLVLAQTSVPQNAFQGTQYQIEFEIPRNLGKVVDAHLNFQMNFTDLAGTTPIPLTPTTLWCDAIEVLYNGNVVERVEREEIHQETVQYLTDIEFNALAPRINLDSTTGGFKTFNLGGTTGTSISGAKSFWLPLWANVFTSAQPYVRGFNGTWKFRLWLTPNIWATTADNGAGGVAGTSPAAVGIVGGAVSFTLSQMYLYVKEAQFSGGIEAAYDRAHQSGCVYRSVIRNKWVKTEQQLSAGQEYQQTLTSFNTDSCGLTLYVKPVPAFPYQFLQKLELGSPDSLGSYVQIRDAANGELTIQLPPDQVIEKNSLWTPVPSVYANEQSADSTVANPQQKYYTFPFCASGQKCLEEGKVQGGYLLTGMERIVINPSRTIAGCETNVSAPPTFGSGGVQVCVVSYEYAKLSCQGNQLSVRRTV